MYADQDGTATKQSQAAYDCSIRRLLFTTSLLSWLGLAAAALNDEYTRDNLPNLLHVREISHLNLSQLLWASHSSPTFRTIACTNTIFSLSYLSTA